MDTYNAWLCGPAALPLAVLLTEDGDRLTLTAQVKYAKLRRLVDKEGTFDAKGNPFDLDTVGLFAENLIAAQAETFENGATAWMQDIVRGIPNRLRFVLTAHFVRDDASPTGITTLFVAEGPCAQDPITATSPQDLRDALLAIG